MLNKISFGTLFGERSENLDAFLVEATSSAVANDDTLITHDLKRVPQGFLILSRNAADTFYDGTGTNTETSFFVKSSGASSVFKIAII